MIRAFLLFALVASAGIPGRAAAPDTGWAGVSWQSERALASTAQGWKAVVSLQRGRLVFFGPTEGDTNLLFSTATRTDAAGWGGHRVWLGPQSTWSKGWPPPAAWEHSGPESFAIDSGVLRLVMPDAGDGWPRLTRTYRWDGAKLVCGVEISGGTRSAQIIEIMQVPRTALVQALVPPDPAAPAGYVLLPAGSNRQLLANFPPPPQVTLSGRAVLLRHIGAILKPGFRPQTLSALVGRYNVNVGRIEATGPVTTPTDEGFLTQVYLGGPEPFIELEQLSPLFSPGGSASFALVLEARSR